MQRVPVKRQIPMAGSSALAPVVRAQHTFAGVPISKVDQGIGLTDPQPISAVLAERLTYCNTYLTTQPRLDIRSDPSPFGELNFLIASEVFEHVEPPLEQAFANAARLLKPSGVLLLTVPWVWDGDPSTALPELYDWRLDREENGYIIIKRTPDGEVERYENMAFDGAPGPSLRYTREHFPQLCDWHLSETGGVTLLRNTRSDGTVETFSNLVFHGGPDLALQMRLFTRGGIEENLRLPVSSRLNSRRDYAEFGILFGHPWSRPVIARKAP